MSAEDSEPDSSPDAPDDDSPELIVKLRARAEELRRQAPEREADDAGPDAGLAADAAPDLASSELLEQWSTEAHYESVHPRRNWAPLFALLALAVVGGLVFLGVGLITTSDEPTSDPTRPDRDAEAATVLDEDPPDLDELTADVTIPPGPAEGLTVADRGVSVVEDRFDPERREGTFAVVIENPHDDWLAQSVQVEVTLRDPDGNAVGSDTAFVEVVLPGQTVAVASHFFDATTAFVAGLDVELDVARWRETDPFEGSFVIADVLTEEAEFSGVRTTALLRSTFDRPLRDVGVTAVYRGEFGQIIGGYDTFLDLLEPGVDTPFEIALLANLSLDQITATEVYPHAGFGFVPDDG